MIRIRTPSNPGSILMMYVCTYVSVTLRNVAVTSRRNAANQRSYVIIIAWKEGGTWELIINPRRACAARVTVVVVCVCLSVCMSVRTRYSGSTRS